MKTCTTQSRTTVRLATFLIAFAALTTSASAATVMVQVAPNGALTFSPAGVSIKPGDTVQWKWASKGMAHSVTSGVSGVRNNIFDSGLVKSDTFTFSHTFASAGTFPYFCLLHFDDGMTGTVNVVAAVPQLTNISTRVQVLTGNDVAIAGFIISGTEAKTVLSRGLGPTLTQLGVQGALPDPTLALLQNGTVLASNDNWKNTQQTAIQASGKAPPNDLESAIISTLSPGSYTAVMAGNNSATGVGLIELYDLSPNPNSTLTNISTRGAVGVGSNVMIAGFIAANANVDVLVRALGPTLTQFGIGNPLADPTLTLVNSNGQAVASNDNWKNTQQAAIQATGLAPPNDLESAVVVSLAPGNYTAIVSGQGGGTGDGLVEVYKLP